MREAEVGRLHPKYGPSKSINPYLKIKLKVKGVDK
jgi:hypothetical protein